MKVSHLGNGGHFINVDQARSTECSRNPAMSKCFVSKCLSSHPSMSSILLRTFLFCIL